MGINGSGASIEASDIVLVDDNPNKVNKAISISRFTRKIVWENILFSLIVKVLFLTLGAFGITGMLSAVIADVGVTVLAILNSLRALYSNNEPHNHNVEQKKHNNEHHKECCCADHDHKECDCKEDDCDVETENHHKHESCHCEHNKIHNNGEHKCCCNEEKNNKKDD